MGFGAWGLGWVEGGLRWVFWVWGGWYWNDGGELLGVNWIWTFGWFDSPGGFFVIGLEKNGGPFFPYNFPSGVPVSEPSYFLRYLPDQDGFLLWSFFYPAGPYMTGYTTDPDSDCM